MGELGLLITDTAPVHAAAWKEMFDSLPRARAEHEDVLRGIRRRRAVVSSSTNCRDVLSAAGIEDLFEQGPVGQTRPTRRARRRYGSHRPGGLMSCR